jgi:hypothetical protein
MKNAKLWVCTLLMIHGSAPLMATPTDQATELSQNQTIHLLDLNARVIQDFCDGKMSDLIVECSEGTALPFKLTLKGEFLALESEAISPLYLKVLKTCYIRCEGQENFLFSTDRQTWKGFSEFFTGELKVSVDAENDGPIAGLQLELNQRKK